MVDNTLNKLRVKKILSAIKHLNKRDQEIIKYKFLYNFSGRELSVLLDIPEKQINITTITSYFNLLSRNFFFVKSLEVVIFFFVFFCVSVVVKEKDGIDMKFRKLKIKYINTCYISKTRDLM